jgi:hypothetical protein
MGAWGPAIFSDDTAADVRDEYRDLLGDAADPVAATDALIERSEEIIADADEGPVFWLALALTQHKLGRLEERVKREALRAIDQGLGLDRWREAGPAALKSRQTALAKARAVLVSPQPAARRIRPRYKDTCEWDAGELVAYQLKSGDWIVLHVLGPHPHQNGVGVIVQVLDWRGDEPPGAEPLKSCNARQVELTAKRWLSRITESYRGHECAALMPHIQVMIDAGLMPAEICADVTRKSYHYVEVAAKRVERDEPEAREQLRALAARRGVPVEPISRLALWRALAAKEMPKTRVRQLGARRDVPKDVSPHLEIGWINLDETLAREFELK